MVETLRPPKVPVMRPFLATLSVPATAAEPSRFWGRRKERLALRSALMKAKVDACACPLIKAVVAEFYARIFFRNSVNGGYLIPFESSKRLCEIVCTGDVLSIDVAKSVLRNKTTGEQWQLNPLGEVIEDLANRLARARVLPPRQRPEVHLIEHEAPQREHRRAHLLALDDVSGRVR